MRSPISILARRLRHQWRHRLTGTGRLLAGSIWIAGIASAATMAMPTHSLLWTLVFIANFSFLAAWLLRPRVRITGTPPAKLTVGQEVRTKILVENTSSLPAYDVGIGLLGLPPGVRQPEDDLLVERIPPGETATLPLALAAERRGVYQMPDLEVYTTFPFNMMRRRGARAVTPPLVVLPRFTPLTTVEIPIGRRHQPGGIALTSHIGESPEYIGNREYRPGDPTRRIDFRSWARLARPVVREYQEEYYCRIALILDTFVGAPRRDLRRLLGRAPREHPSLEGAVSLCAAVADALGRGEHVIDLFAAGPDLYVFRSGRNITHFENVLEILACVEGCRRSPFETIGPAVEEELQNITTAVCLFLDWDAERERFARRALESGARVRIVIVRDGPTTAPLVGVEDWAGTVTQVSPDDVLAGAVESL